ncbi:hypothetical protein F8M41_018602 [Gigaspora margarita]|uniref:Uncharacterized protein n=1 Tax=Gigaspora margarita TaxID=4874 RepID=A0A8H4ALH4_GIGMA|nr:hypothetical protein F8M41_018602 [Gigaspora margarita]
MKIIANEFYIYANDINYISTHFAIKNKEHVKVDNRDDTKVNYVDDVEDNQPKTEEPVQANQDSETNYEDKGSSGKNGKRSTRVTRNGKKKSCLTVNSDDE